MTLKNALLPFLMILCSDGVSGGIEAINPLEALRQDPAVQSVESMEIRAIGPVLRVRLQSRQDELYIMLSNEAATLAEAGQVRQIALWLNVPAGQSLKMSSVHSLTGLASNLGHLCLNQQVTGLLDALQPYRNRRLPDLKLLRSFPNGIMVEVVPSLPWATPGSSVKVTLSLTPAAPLLRCALPVVPST